MAKNPPERMPQCCPYLFYDDLERALRFLKEAFGLETDFSHAGPDGKIGHAQVRYGAGVLMLGLTKQPQALRPTKSPKESGSLHSSVYLYVDDVDAHCKRARKARAEILMDPADMFWGDRLYCAVDPEGQFWCFATHVRDVSPDEMKPPGKGA